MKWFIKASPPLCPLSIDVKNYQRTENKIEVKRVVSYINAVMLHTLHHKLI